MANSNPEQERTMAEMLRRVSVERGLDALLKALATEGEISIAGSTDDLLETLKTRLNLGVNGLKELEEGLIRIGMAEYMDDDDLRQKSPTE